MKARLGFGKVVDLWYREETRHRMTRRIRSRLDYPTEHTLNERLPIHRVPHRRLMDDAIDGALFVEATP